MSLVPILNPTTTTVYEITIDGPEFVSIQTYPGMMMTPAGERVTGRHDTTKTRLRAVVQFADGSQNRNPLEGFVTDSARDAVLWASELASSGNFRRALEIPHAVLTTAFAQQDATLRAERDEWRQR